jgi:geranylgeranyl diphosphate synthase type I
VKAFLAERRTEIAAFLERELAAAEGPFSLISPWGADVAQRLRGFSTRGKMIRGGLVAMGAQLFGTEANADVVRAGAVMELIQSFLLIHDDIMDRDTSRRGEESVFSQYAGLARAEGIEDWYHLGEALGTCVGDVAMLYAFDILEGLEGDDAVRSRVRRLVSREITYVGLAQMSDLYFGETQRPVSEQEVIDLYRYKTGRYTFSLPLSVGAVLAGRGDTEVAVLSRLGEKLGIIFQIKDDELGLFGSETQTGKPQGSDIAENKKTLFRRRLFDRASGAEQQELSRLFGNRELSSDGVSRVLELLRRHGIPEEIDEVLVSWAERAREDVEELARTTDADVEMLRELLSYNLSRSS